MGPIGAGIRRPGNAKTLGLRGGAAVSEGFDRRMREGKE